MLETFIPCTAVSEHIFNMADIAFFHLTTSKNVLVISRFMCRKVMAALGRAYYFCMGFRVVVKGKQAGSIEAPILAVAPHSTFFDGIVCIVAGLPSTVSRVENLATPIFGSETLFICFLVSVKGSTVAAYVFVGGAFLFSQPPVCVNL